MGYGKAKRITLPSGASVAVRALKPLDFAAMGQVPLLYMLDAPEGKRKAETPEQRAEAFAYGAEMQRVVLTRCVWDLRAEGETYGVITAKRPHECGPGELAAELVPAEDAAAMMQAVMAESGMTSDAVAGVRPFSEKQAGAGDGASAGDALPPAAE